MLLNCIVIGFFHEQSRPDRDSHVVINWDNIEPGMEYNFRKCGNCITQDLEYDYKSIMHYPGNAFSKNGQPTIQKIGCPDCELGGNEFTELDVKGINELYSCSGGGPNCSDNSEHCSHWAGLGYCTKYYVAYMRVYCKKTCNVCS